MVWIGELGVSVPFAHKRRTRDSISQAASTHQLAETPGLASNVRKSVPFLLQVVTEVAGVGGWYVVCQNAIPTKHSFVTRTNMAVFFWEGTPA